MSFGQAERASLDRPITTAAQLLVEGRSPEIFFREMVEKFGFGLQVQVRTFGAKDKDTLQTWLEIFTQKPAFKETVRVLGVVRDAESEPAESAFQTVCSALRATSLPVPERMRAFAGDALKVGVFILPDCSDQGMLESLCLQVIQMGGPASSKPAIKCAGEFLACLKKAAAQPKNETKATLGAYLISQDVYEAQIGRAAQSGVFNWDASAFADLRAFLQDLVAAGGG